MFFFFTVDTLHAVMKCREQHIPVFHMFDSVTENQCYFTFYEGHSVEVRSRFVDHVDCYFFIASVFI